ncbi:uncharacterized protein UMAG_03764 [Mycosarcoma maydis]|uniref:Uncharacterized protein n=1 Tax=Mycosarcoma maydis TaxID=5270 RepID=A0A0D1DV87_MYCMD|nr:uncharacterized protein UMAG_03764 [Ustilago maydis 521]KIS68184.1 hypothetical protein UMAG_03764 [Ustilago maydis 521]|eukprot:XP_011390217.1 hypothetical protein UMAG_03764 [Ustilago maydis 521]
MEMACCGCSGMAEMEANGSSQPFLSLPRIAEQGEQRIAGWRSQKPSHRANEIRKKQTDTPPAVHLNKENRATQPQAEGSLSSNREFSTAQQQSLTLSNGLSPVRLRLRALKPIVELTEKKKKTRERSREHEARSTHDVRPSSAQLQIS